jgi:hypothetical protein
MDRNVTDQSEGRFVNRLEAHPTHVLPQIQRYLRRFHACIEISSGTHTNVCSSAKIQKIRLSYQDLTHFPSGLSLFTLGQTSPRSEKDFRKATANFE